MYEYIEFLICYGENLTPDEVKVETRKMEIVFARQLIMYFCKKHKIDTLDGIGHKFGGKDHATVIHAYKTIQNYIDTDKMKRAKIEDYGRLIEKMIAFAERKKEQFMREFLKPLEEEIENLESRCNSLKMELACLRTGITEVEMTQNKPLNNYQTMKREREEVKNIILDFIENAPNECELTREEIKESHSIRDDLSLDSMDCVELILHCEKELNIGIPDVELDDMATMTIGELTDLVTNICNK